MKLWTDLEPVDESFFRTAAHRHVFPMDLAAGADEVWAGLTSTKPLTWCRALSGSYVSPPPYGAGAKREVAVLGGLRLKEHFFAWDDDERRHSFYVERATAPLFRAFAEDYSVEPTASGCRFTWSFAYEARPGFGLALSAAEPGNRLLFSSLVRDTCRWFGRATR